MPASGPDLEYARRQGNKVGKELYKLMMEKYYLWEPDGKSILLAGSAKRWADNKKNFILAVEEFFVEDACNGW